MLDGRLPIDHEGWNEWSALEDVKVFVQPVKVGGRTRCHNLLQRDGTIVHSAGAGLVRRG